MAEIVNIDSISLTRNDDIAFLIYVLMNNRWDDAARLFKLRPEKQNNPERLKATFEQISKLGHPKELKVYKDSETYYPAGDELALASLYTINKIETPVVVVPRPSSPPKTLESGYFKGMPEKVISDLSLRKKILAQLEQTFRHEIMSREYHSYHWVRELGIRGERDCIRRFELNNLPELIRGKRVLDIGSNMGMVSFYAADTASEVVGIEPYGDYYIVAEELRNYYGKQNVRFLKETFEEHLLKGEQYDAVFSFAISYWSGSTLQGLMEKVKRLVAPGGVLYFESHIKKKMHKSKADMIKALINAGWDFEFLESEDHLRMFIRCVPK